MNTLKPYMEYGVCVCVCVCLCSQRSNQGCGGKKEATQIEWLADKHNQ